MKVAERFFAGADCH